jgi:hypothetical protein
MYIPSAETAYRLRMSEVKPVPMKNKPVRVKVGALYVPKPGKPGITGKKTAKGKATGAAKGNVKAVGPTEAAKPFITMKQADVPVDDLLKQFAAVRLGNVQQPDKPRVDSVSGTTGTTTSTSGSTDSDSDSDSASSIASDYGMDAAPAARLGLDDAEMGLQGAAEAAKPAMRVSRVEDLFPYAKYDVPRDVLRRLAMLEITPQQRAKKLVVENYEALKLLNRVTAKFSEKVRMRCKHSLSPSGLSPFEYYMANKVKLDQQLKQINNMPDRKARRFERTKIRREIIKNTRECTYFNVSRVVYLMKYLFGNNLAALRKLKWLDMSSGWGDRLVGAIALGMTYHGVDPSKSMKPVYRRIIDTLVPADRRDRYRVDSLPFEDVPEEADKYDVAFTSPPFFDFEVYDDSEDNQSHKRYPTAQEWIHKFIVPYALKAWRAVKKGGYLGLYIGEDYIKPIKAAIGVKADVLRMGYDNRDVRRKIYIWRKPEDDTIPTPTPPAPVASSSSDSESSDSESTPASPASPAPAPAPAPAPSSSSSPSSSTGDAAKAKTPPPAGPPTRESVMAALRKGCVDGSGKIMNPDSGKCVLEKGATGKRIIKEAMAKAGIQDGAAAAPAPEAKKPAPSTSSSSSSSSSPARPVPPAEVKRVAGKTMEEIVAELRDGCPPGKVRNTTGRCVAETGAIGKKIIKEAMVKAGLEGAPGAKPKAKPKAAAAKPKVAKFGDLYLPLSKILVEGDPVKEPKHELKMNVAPAYYQNNRENFIQEINKLFAKHKKDIIAQEKEKPSCDARKKKASGDGFSLMTHQKIVQDYIHHMSPYRGLLIYHGLGSGKTCSSIAIAEGLKYQKKVFIMTPASIRSNYIKELKNCGDQIYTTNHHWVFVGAENPAYAPHMRNLCAKYNVNYAYAKKAGGLWVTLDRPAKGGKRSNYADLNSAERASLQAQIDHMIHAKYQFINYNGIRMSGLDKIVEDRRREMGVKGGAGAGAGGGGEGSGAGPRVNPFDHAVIVIDEAHNFVSRIVNKITKKKPDSLFYRLYEYLMDAEDCRLVCLTGTPIINYPNEMGVLFNMLRGYIKTFRIPLRIPSDMKSVTREKIRNIVKSNHELDYMDYSKGVLTVTMNPYGFVNKASRSGDYKGVHLSKAAKKGGAVVDQRRFLENLAELLSTKRIEFDPAEVELEKNKLLPDTFDDFADLFVDMTSMAPMNQMLLKQRILGLTSYYRSAQESLLPRYDEMKDMKVVSIPMSDYQFSIYEEIRAVERDQEKRNAKKRKQNKGKDVYTEVVSTYRIFSRAACNFVFPEEVPRPMPKDGENVAEALDGKLDEQALDNEDVGEVAAALDGSHEADDADALARERSEVVDDTYAARIQAAVSALVRRRDEFLTPEGLSQYSPKFAAVLDNILSASADPARDGLHLIYSSFRNLEGIELFRHTLEANGFSQFKLKKNAAGEFVVNMTEEEIARPSYMLYTGKESVEEKETMRNIYNGNWSVLNSSLRKQLKNISGERKNVNGEVIKVIMITASGAEGIDLKNTRYVHVMESYWHPVRMEQVIGRARRICSHMDLPPAKQTVEVFVYLMTFTKDQIGRSIDLRLRDAGRLTDRPLSSDEALHEISMIKKNMTQKLLKNVKESSIDCAIHNRPGSGEKLVCYRVQKPSADRFGFTPAIRPEQKDAVVKMNVQKVKHRYGVVEVPTKRKPKGEKFVMKVDKANKPKTTEVFDYKSYKAIKKSGLQIDPDFVGRIKKNKKTGLFDIV